MRPAAGAHDGATRPGAAFWVGCGVGWALIAYGVWGFVTRVGRPLQTAEWVAATVLTHDALVAPVVVVVGLVVAAIVPRRGRGPVAGGLAATAVVLAFSYPLLRGFGRRADNASILPLDYPRDVAIVVGLVWVTAGACWWLQRRRARPDREP